MKHRDHHLWCLARAETQFRLASAVRLAAMFQRQPFDLPVVWTHGHQTVSEVILTQNEGEFGAWGLQRSTTYLMAAAVLEAIQDVIPNAKTHSDQCVVAAYQISRMIRNAFTHAPQWPVWNIDADCRGKKFEIRGVMTLDTTDLNAKPFDWRHYGGPLAIVALLRFVRREILNESEAPSLVIPLPEHAYWQQGDLILERINDAEHLSAVHLTHGDGK